MGRNWPPAQPFDGTPPPVKAGDPVEIRDANGQWWPAVAASEPRYDFDRGITPRTYLTVAVDRQSSAPATYSLPAEPPETVTELWDRRGNRWERTERLTGPCWRMESVDAGMLFRAWHELLVYGPLSTVPPERKEAQ